MKKLYFFLVILCCGRLLYGQGGTTGILYKGFIDGRMPVTLFLKPYTNACNAEINYQAMYRYERRSQWLQLYITTNEADNFACIEHGFTGALILKKEKEQLDGIWISPDGARQLKVKLKQVPLSAPEEQEYEKTLDQINYEHNDC